MVDAADRRSLPRFTMDHLSRAYVFPALMALAILGERHFLGHSSGCVVLGYCDIQILPMASGLSRDMADSVGSSIEETDGQSQ